MPSFAADTPTLLACNLGSLVVQATTQGVGYSTAGETNGATWESEGGKKVTLAAVDGENLLVAVEGGVVVLLGVRDGSIIQLG
jgi:hypothetical protein